MVKYSILFTLGESEAYDIIRYVETPADLQLQEKGFSFYCNKLTEMLQDF